MANEESLQPWAEVVQKMVAKMTAEELAEFPDLKITDEAHTLIFTATRQLSKPASGISLIDAISACGRRLRAIRRGLATSHDLMRTFAVGLRDALKPKVQGIDGGKEGWPSWDPKQPLEVHMGNMLIMEWQGMYILDVNDEQASLLTAQLENALQLWRNESYRKQVMDRLQEIGVVDFDADDFHSRLLQLVADFYLKHPAGAPLKQRGISLLEEIVVFDKEAFASAERLTGIKIEQGNPRGAYDISHRAMEVAIASGFRFNAARLGLCTAATIMAGALGPTFSMEQVQPLLEASRRRLDACKFWLLPRKYERYSGMLRYYEIRLKITPESSNPDPGEPSSNGISTQLPTEPTEPNTIVGQTLRHCSGCKEPSIETKKCSGCREVYYCSTKCQKGHWSSHKETCKRKQAERKKLSGGGK